MIEGLSHITLITRDLDRMSAIVTQVLDGREVYSSGDDTFSVSREKFFLVGGQWIAVMEGESLPTRPGGVANLTGVRRLPVAIAAFVVLLGLASLAHALGTTVRRRRHDLATLRCLGLTARQTAACIVWQSVTIGLLALAIGTPLGMIAGRAAWWAATNPIGVSPDVSRPITGLLELCAATLVAVGIGLHNLGEGLAIGSSFALGELALGSFLMIGFMVHNITEGLGIAAPVATSKVSVGRLVALCLLAGAPAIVGAWIGGFLTNEVVGVLFFAIAVGAALQVVVEVGRYVSRRAPGGLGSGYVVGGSPAGLAIMYLTGLLIG